MDEISRRKPPGLAALIEVGLLFLPAVPAYLWVWPRVQGSGFWLFQSLSYGYILIGTLIIGLRRWRLHQLGVNFSGIGLSLACTTAILVGRQLIIGSVDLGLGQPKYDLWELIGECYFILGSSQ